VIRRDPGGRGLASYQNAAGRGLLTGELFRAIDELSLQGRRAALFTGFAILTDDGPIAETDGPPGTIYLAAMLQACGMEPQVVTDRVGEPVLRAGLAAVGLDVPLLVAPPVGSDAVGRDAVRSWWREVGGDVEWSHYIAIERVGPSHTAPSLAAQYADANEAAQRLGEFARIVPLAEHDVRHNMRGAALDACTAPLDVLFDDCVAQSPRPATIGIVDGGNEIGCGKIPWHQLHEAVARGNGATIACRTKTDATILAGASNWGAYALGAAVARTCDRRSAVEAWTCDKQRMLIAALVEQGGAVDGVTKRREATVDGIALDEYLAVFDEIRQGALSN
jgi:hypothetical protein